jgi:serine/threonine protein kinase
MQKYSDSNCPDCGAPIPVNAPHGLCPQCLLQDVSSATHEETEAAKATTTPDQAALEETFPDLEFKELIGRGGMGFVYRVRQTKLERDVALKILPEELASDPAFAERFSREGRLLAKLNHPNIVAVHDFGQAGPFFFLMMEFVDGVNLRQAMQAGKFTPEQALSVVPKICDALQYAHDKGVLHRDIKPENILMDTQGRIKIADFGIAKMVDPKATKESLTVTGARLGTPHYMAPEQVEASVAIDHRADIYSLGVVFYELLTGELPIGRFEAPSGRLSLDDRIDEIVLRALEKDRERRQQSASEVKTEVEGLASPRTTPPPSQSTERGRRSIESKVYAPAIGLGLVGAVNLAVMVSHLENVFPPSMTPYTAALAFISGLLFYSALKVKNLEHRGLGLFGGIVAFCTFPWTLIGFPIGIWVLNVLHNHEVKAAFDDSHDRSPSHRKRLPTWLVVLLIILLGLPLLGFALISAWTWASYDPRAEATIHQPFTNQIVASPTATGALSAEVGGKTISLEALQAARDDNDSWIAPQSHQPLELSVDTSNLTVVPQTGEQLMRCLLRSTFDYGEGDISSLYLFPRQGTMGSQSVSLMDGARWTLATFASAGHPDTFDLYARVTFGDYTNLASCPSEQVESNYSHQGGTHGGSSWELTFASPHHDADSTTIILAHNFENDDSKALRLVAETQAGDIMVPDNSQLSAQHLTATFAKLPLDQVQRFHAQIRQSVTVAFRNIPNPNTLPIH